MHRGKHNVHDKDIKGTTNYTDKSSSVNSNLSISIIIPAYNEEKRITKCLTRTLQYCIQQQWDFEILVAVDGSTDNTAKIVESFQSNDNRVKLILLENRMGKGGAVTNAIVRARSQYIAYMDADLSADPSELKRLLIHVDNYDIVIGSRILRGTLPPIERPFIRSFLSHTYAKAFRLLFRLQIYDPQCGLKVLRKNEILKFLPELQTSGFAFDSELLVIASVLGLRIKEIPINWTHDKGSKIDIMKQITVMGFNLLSIWKKARSLQNTNKENVNSTVFSHAEDIMGMNYNQANIPPSKHRPDKE